MKRKSESAKKEGKMGEQVCDDDDVLETPPPLKRPREREWMLIERGLVGIPDDFELVKHSSLLS